jgi:hypothetical protein
METALVAMKVILGMRMWMLSGSSFPRLNEVRIEKTPDRLEGLGKPFLRIL